MRVASINKFFLLLLIPVFRLAGIFIKKREPAVVVFFTGKMGDLVCVTPVFTAIKQKHENAKLYLIARAPFTEILLGNPYLDEIITFKKDTQLLSLSWLISCWLRLRKAHLLYFFNLLGSFDGNILGSWLSPDKKCFSTFNDGKYNSAKQDKSQKFFLPFYSTHEFRYDMRLRDFYLQMISTNGIPVKDPANVLFFPDENEQVNSFFEKAGIQKNDTIIGVAIGSGKGYKAWPEDRWVEFLKSLAANYQCRIVFFGSEGERKMILEVGQQVPGDHILIIDQPLTQVPYFLKKCKLFVSVDMGLSYIADALQVPVVNIMGPVDETQQSPENIFRLVSDRTVCRRILKTPVTPLSKKDLQDIATCFAAISADSVLKACRDFLN